MKHTTTTVTPTYHAYRLLWRWAAKPLHAAHSFDGATWHDRGFFLSQAEAEVAAATITAQKGAGALTAILEYTHTPVGQ
jgi:hypothetical protein